MFSPDLYEFVKLLIENQVEHLIVGGYALGIHGQPRYYGVYEDDIKHLNP